MEVNDFIDFIQKNDTNYPAQDRYPLHTAIRNSNLEAARRLSTASDSIESLDDSGLTPLLTACLWGSARMTEFLLEKNASVNACSTRTLQTPLLAVCQRGSADHLRLLLDAGAEIDAYGLPEGTTPLIYACSTGALKLVAMLLERGAKVDLARKSDGGTAFYVAWCGRHFQIMHLLLRFGTPSLLSVDKNRDAVLGLLRLAIGLDKSTDWELVREVIIRLKTHPGNISPAYFELFSALPHLLLTACGSGDIELVQKLLDHHSQLDANNTSSGLRVSPLLMASLRGHHPVMQLLLARGAASNALSADGAMSPLHACIARGDIDGMKLLLLRGKADANLVLRSGTAAGCTPLRMASQFATNNKNIKMMTQLLLCCGASATTPSFERDLSLLHLTNTELEAIPLADSPQVVALQLASNCLTHLQADLLSKRYPALTSLRLDHNSLTTIPPHLSTLSHLSYLDLSSNNISDITPILSDARPVRLMSLLLRGNPLSSLPLRIYTLSSLTTLEVDPSANLGIPPSVLRLPTLELFRFLQAIEQKSILWNNVKLLLVGEENVGKTSLAQFLRSGLLVDPAQPNISTNGIAISDWTINGWRLFCSGCLEYTPANAPSQSVDLVAKFRRELLNASSELAMPLASTPPAQLQVCPKCQQGRLIFDTVTLSVWDFGGQDVFYPTHSLFLSDRSIYLVLFDCSKNIEQNARMEYWLRHINAFARNRPPIHLVGTHRDQLHETSIGSVLSVVDAQYKRGWCGNVRGVHAISCVKRIGLDDLRAAILETAQKLLTVQRVPSYYLSLHQVLLSMKSDRSDYCTFAELEARARERIGLQFASDGAFRNELRTAFQFFTDCGTILYVDTPELRDLVVLDPRWLANVFSTIITFRPNFVDRSTGLISLTDLRQLWKAYPSELHSKLLRILVQFGIAFQYQNSVILPDLLCAQPKDLKQKLIALWESAVGEAECGRLYSFDFLPLGFFSRLVIAVFTSFGMPERHELWMNTMLFTCFSRTSVVYMRYNPQRHELDVRVRVSTIADADKVLTAVIDVVESTLSGFYAHYSNQITRMLMCPSCLRTMRNTASPPHLFSIHQFAECLCGADKTRTLHCDNENSAIMLEILAPDLALHGLPVIADADVQKGCELGKGAFGRVWKAQWNVHTTVAVKEIVSPKDATASESIQQFLSFQKEVALMCQLHHPNLITLHGVMLQPLRMVLELAPLGDLYHFLHDKSVLESQLPYRLRFKLALDVAQGMNFLHQQTTPILHRDLRSPNIFLMTLDECSNDGTAVVNAKVADFGLAQKLLSDSGLTDRLETWQWMAPEAFGLQAHASYSEKADVYSFAIVLYEICSRKYPFSEYLDQKMNVFKLKEGICREQDPVRPSIDRYTCPAKFAAIIRSCWHADPSQRPTFFEVVHLLRHLWETSTKMQSSTPALSRAGHTSATSNDASTATGVPVIRNCGILSRHTDETKYITSLHLAPDGRIWSGSTDGTIFVYDAISYAQLISWSNTHTTRVYSITSLPHSKVVATASEDCVVNLWSQITLCFVTAIRGNHHSVLMRAVVAFADPERPWDQLWTSDAAGHIKAWKVAPVSGTNADSGQSPGVGIIGRNRSHGSGAGSSHGSTAARAALLQTIALPNGESVCSMCVAQDSGVIIGCDGTLLKLHPQMMRELHRRSKAHRGRITALASAAENLIVTAAEDYSVAIWDLSLVMQHRVTYHTGKIHSLSVVRAVFLWSSGFDLRLCLYDLRPHKLMGNVIWADKALFTLEEVASDSICALCAVDTGPDTGVLWMSSRDGTLRVFELHMQASSVVPQPVEAMNASPLRPVGWIRKQPGRDSPSPNSHLAVTGIMGAGLSRLSKARGPGQEG